MAPRAIREIRVEGNVAFVPLTQGYEAVIDAADVPLVQGRRWHVRNVSKVRYAQSSTVARDGGKPRKLHMHRVVLDAPADLEVDHIDGDGLNNRRENLRLATKSQNQANRGPSAVSTSGLKGVSFHRRVGMWQAFIKARGKVYWLGYHATPEDAHKAYASSARDLFGEFGRY